DRQLATLDDDNTPAVAKLKARWEYLKAALSDLNSNRKSLAGVSAPTTVDRHSRAMTTQWMAMY
ncbi:hypothetical protein HP532_16790, partial [Pseudomonas sp. CrR25]|nr:hypothetical protein [Pseudomonas sp. CrR25]